METPSPDGPADLRRFGLAQVDLFASLETSHWQLFYSLTTTKPSGEPASTAPGGGRPSLALLCPVRALRHYVDRTQSFRTSDQLFVCHGGRQKGNAVSKQRMAHWIVDAITLAYQAQGVPCPFRLRAHSTRSEASSWALARGTSMTDICRAAGWATPNTFARFYSLRVEPVSSCVLTSNG